jgi:hypothetical protein
MSRSKNETNLKLAGLFVVLVGGLIFLSLILKLVFVVRDSNFDGKYNFTVGFRGPSNTRVVSFSPQNKTISTIVVQNFSSKSALGKNLEIPIDGVLSTNRNIEDKDIATLLLKSASPFSNSLEGLTFFDAFRLSVFAKSVQQGSVYNRDLSDNLSSAQKSTVISLTFTDPEIYRENQSVQIINASSISGAGGRLANLITNIGGSPILVTTANNAQKVSKIIYYKTKSYTVKRLSTYLGFPLEESDKKGISDVTIIIGTDKNNNLNF